MYALRDHNFLYDFEVMNSNDFYTFILKDSIKLMLNIYDKSVNKPCERICNMQTLLMLTII